MLAGILLIAANLRAPFTALPPLLGPIQQDLGLSTVATGALTTLPLLAFALLSPLSAMLGRRHGLERSLFCAMVLVALGIALRSAGASWSLYAGTWIIGMGIAVGNVLLPSLVKRDFPASIASLTGAYALVMGIAAALGSAAVIPLADAWGWRLALLAFLVLPLTAMAAWASRLCTQAKPNAAATTDSRREPIWRSALAWQVTLFLGLNSTIYYITIGWLPTILVDAGLSAAKAGSLHGVMQLATAVPGLLIAPLLHRLRDQRLPAAGSALMSAVALLGYLLAPQQAFLWSVLFGVGTGATIILGLAFIGLRTRNVPQAAALSGMAQCLGYLLAATGPIAMGAMHDWLNGWTAPLLLCTGLALITAFVGLLAGRNLYVGSPAAEAH